MYFLQYYAERLDAFTFFGISIFLCHTMGEIFTKTKFIPRISGYILTGIILGPTVFNLIDIELISEMRILTDISIGLIFFIIGRHLDIKWLINDKGLLLTCIFEFLLTLLGIFVLIFSLGWSLKYSLLAAIVISSTSPAIILLIVQDLNAEGPITRRTLVITSVNNFFAISLFSLMFPFIDTKDHSVNLLLLNSAYRLVGSILLGYCFFKITEILTRYIFKKTIQDQFVLLISILILSVSVSKYLNLSVFLSLMTIGITTRNLDFKHRILDYNLNAYTHIFFIPLFFITGCYLNFSGFLYTSVIIIACILIRTVSKIVSVLIFKDLSGITKKQALAIGYGLLPLSGSAMGITAVIEDFDPQFAFQLLSIISSSICFFGLLGPIVLQSLLLKNNEAFENEKKV